MFKTWFQLCKKNLKPQSVLSFENIDLKQFLSYAVTQVILSN